MLVIKHNPGIYVVEQSDHGDTWGAATVVNTFLDFFFFMRKEHECNLFIMAHTTVDDS